MKTFSSKKELQEAIKAQITANNNQAVKAMLRIYEYQTVDEQSHECTAENNGVGFAGTDAYILTSFCKQYQKYGRLSDKQMSIVKQKIGKYAGQLMNHAIANGIYVKVDNMWTIKK